MMFFARLTFGTTFLAAASEAAPSFNQVLASSANANGVAKVIITASVVAFKLNCFIEILLNIF